MTGHGTKVVCSRSTIREREAGSGATSESKGRRWRTTVVAASKSNGSFSKHAAALVLQLAQEARPSILTIQVQRNTKTAKSHSLSEWGKKS